MRTITVAFSLVLLFWSAAFAVPDSPESQIECSYASFTATVQITKPTELKIPMSGSIYLAVDRFRLEVTNSITREEIWIIGVKADETVSLVFPDTLNGVTKAVSADSPLWFWLETKLKRDPIMKSPHFSCSQNAQLDDADAVIPGVRCETSSGFAFDIWWNSDDVIEQVVWQHAGKSVQLELIEHESIKKVSSDIFLISSDYLFRELEPDEEFNPFQL